MRLDEPGTITRVRVDKRHAVVAPTVCHNVGIKALVCVRLRLSLGKPELRHDENCAVNVLSGGHAFRFQRTVNSHYPGKREILRRVNRKIVGVPRLNLPMTNQRRIKKIRIQQDIRHIEKPSRNALRLKKP